MIYEEEKLYSTGYDELDNLMEKAFCDGYYYAQRVYAESEEDEEKKSGIGKKIAKGAGYTAAGLTAATALAYGGSKGIQAYVKKLEKEAKATGNWSRYNKFIKEQENHLIKYSKDVTDAIEGAGSKVADYTKTGAGKVADYAKTGWNKTKEGAGKAYDATIGKIVNKFSKKDNA